MKKYRIRKFSPIWWVGWTVAWTAWNCPWWLADTEIYGEMYVVDNAIEMMVREKSGKVWSGRVD